jgi:predicted glycosyltransferase
MQLPFKQAILPKFGPAFY